MFLAAQLVHVPKVAEEFREGLLRLGVKDLTIQAVDGRAREIDQGLGSWG